MKSFLSLPTSQDFYDRYAHLIHTLNRTTPLTQIISAATEIGVIYSITYKAVHQVLPELATALAITCAVLGTALLELGLRVLFPYGWRAILYRRFTGLDCLMSVAILLALGMLATASGTLSFKGGKEAVISNLPPPELDTTAEDEATADKDRRTALATFAADSAQIATRYTAQIQATGASYAAQIEAAKGKVQYYRQREAITGNSYASAKAREAQRANELEAERAQAIAQLRSTEAEEIRTAATARTTALASITEHLEDARAEIEAGNKKTEEEHRAKTNGIGLGVGWFTIICLLYFALVTLLYEAMKKGSGMEDKPAPNHYTFAPGILAEATGAVSERWNYWTRNAIQRFADSTPAPPLPANIKSMYDLAGIRADVVQLEALDEDTGGGNVLRIPRQADRRLMAGGATGTAAGTGTTATAEDLENKVFHLIGAGIALESDNYHDEAAKYFLQAEDVLKMYLGPDHHPKEFTEIYNGCILHMNGAGPNPFEHHHRRNPIGFRKASGGDPEPTHEHYTVTPEEARRLITALEEEAEKQRTAGNEEAAKRCEDQVRKLKEQLQQNAPANGDRYNGDRYTAEKSAADSRTRNCKQCGQPFTYRHWNKKYCSDQCKLDFHAEKHGGQRFDPAEYRKGKKRRK